MNYTIIYSKKAEKDIKEFENSGEKEELRKIAELTEELKEHPENGEGKVEELHTISSGREIPAFKGKIWSRRVNHEDRMVYTIDSKNMTVEIISLRGHYGDH